MLSTLPPDTTEQVLSQSSALGVNFDFITGNGRPGLTMLPSGIMFAHIWQTASGGSEGPTVGFDFGRITSGGIKTILATSSALAPYNVAPNELTITAWYSACSLAPTDRLYFNVWTEVYEWQIQYLLIEGYSRYTHLDLLGDASGLSGFSGQSGRSGWSGQSGWSGWSGWLGTSQASFQLGSLTVGVLSAASYQNSPKFPTPYVSVASYISAPSAGEASVIVSPTQGYSCLAPVTILGAFQDIVNSGTGNIYAILNDGSLLLAHTRNNSGTTNQAQAALIQSMGLLGSGLYPEKFMFWVSGGGPSGQWAAAYSHCSVYAWEY